MLEMRKTKDLLTRRSILGWLLVILPFIWHRIEDLHTVSWLVEKLPFERFRLNHPDSLQVAMFASGLVWLSFVLLWPKKAADIEQAHLPTTSPTPVGATEVLLKSGSKRLVNVTPSYLMGLLRGEHTSIQAAKLVEVFIGKWIKVSGALDDVSGVADARLLTFADRLAYMLFRREWFDHLSTLRRGDILTVVGQIKEVTKSMVILDHCEIVDS
jgi:hypothetical protein